MSWLYVRRATAQPPIRFSLVRSVRYYKVRSKINETFVIKIFLVAPSVNKVLRWKVICLPDFQWQFHDIRFSGSEVIASKLSVCLSSVQKWVSNKELISNFVLKSVKRFRDGREDINDDEHTGRPKSVITENSTEIAREFIKNEPKSSLKFMESEWNISKTSIYRILTDHLGLRKVCARFVLHKLTDD